MARIALTTAASLLLLLTCSGLALAAPPEGTASDAPADAPAEATTVDGGEAPAEPVNEEPAPESSEQDACPCDDLDWRCKNSTPACGGTAEAAPQPAPGPVTGESAPRARTGRDGYRPDRKPVGTMEEVHAIPATGGYILVNVAGVTRYPDKPFYTWGIDGGGWFALGDTASIGAGVRFEHVAGEELRFGVPLRIAAGNDRVAGYGSFSAGLASFSGYCLLDDMGELDCDNRLTGANIGFGLGLMVLVAKGFTMGFEPGMNHAYLKEQGADAGFEIPSFTFRTWIGWKFGKRERPRY